MAHELTAQALLSWMAQSGERLALIDVRSEGEFEQGSLPGFRNLPILNNAERHEIGLAYKLHGQEIAVRLGHELVAPHRNQRTQAWVELIRQSGKPGVVCCWRGGLRSKIAAEWIRENAGTEVSTVQGGYKALRAELVKTELPSTLVITGLTGSRKTELLSFAGRGAVDLEDLASHRGSSFGRMHRRAQPEQSTFENHLYFEIFKRRSLSVSEILLEDESVNIGSVRLPVAIKDRITSSPVVLVKASMAERVEAISRDYVLAPLRDGLPQQKLETSLIEALHRISRRMGGLISSQIEQEIHGAFSADPYDLARHQGWISLLLENHYDKLYRSAFEKLGRAVLFEGNYEECKRWIQNRFGSPGL